MCPASQAQPRGGQLVGLVSDLQEVQTVHTWVAQRPGLKRHQLWVWHPGHASVEGSAHTGPQFPRLLHG